MTNASPALCVRVQNAALRHAAATARFDHEMGAQAGLTLSTYEASFIDLLHLHGPLSPGELGRLAGLSSSGTITGVIDRLEQAGYVQRARCVNDRRKVEVTLNNELLEQENAPRLQRLAAILADYDKTQLDTIADFLNRLADVETAAAAPAPASAPAPDTGQAVS
ncbi:DNA-binding MarR family transcriptional regulator [Murinocardiopsis flavida]|uniref:DNA-binding MarR family transcriptional regulator n=1 Tax=Murinocardiopsis flavida TaxID=645275 RepID=A0A2P8D3H1_9ACTN|nr:MarR family transcriptional regulator [Murinocardiopsis flavida]PSK91768.1 DNA-binding MarR family transcriptional regulator [Murinocardiopsis flavida]